MINFNIGSLKNGILIKLTHEKRSKALGLPIKLFYNVTNAVNNNDNPNKPYKTSTEAIRRIKWLNKYKNYKATTKNN